MKLTKYYALLLGVAFTLAGAGGFIPLFSPPMEAGALPLVIDAYYGRLLTLFPINLVHNLFHLGTGIWGILVWRNFKAARQYCKVMGVTLGILTVFGLLPGFNTLFGVWPLYSHDIWLHGVEAAAALYLGFFLRESRAVTQQQAAA